MRVSSHFAHLHEETRHSKSRQAEAAGSVRANTIGQLHKRIFQARVLFAFGIHILRDCSEGSTGAHSEETLQTRGSLHGSHISGRCRTFSLGKNGLHLTNGQCSGEILGIEAIRLEPARKSLEILVVVIPDADRINQDLARTQLPAEVRRPGCRLVSFGSPEANV